MMGYEITRRNFVKCSLIAAGAMTVGGLCFLPPTPAFAYDNQYGRISTYAYYPEWVGPEKYAMGGLDAASVKFGEGNVGLGKVKPGLNVNDKNVKAPGDHIDILASSVVEFSSVEECKWTSDQWIASEDESPVYTSWFATCMSRAAPREPLEYLGSTNTNVASVQMCVLGYRNPLYFGIEPKGEGVCTLLFAAPVSYEWSDLGEAVAHLDIQQRILPLYVKVGEGSASAQWTALDSSIIKIAEDTIGSSYINIKYKDAVAAEAADFSSIETCLSNEIVAEYAVPDAISAKSPVFNLAFYFGCGAVGGVDEFSCMFDNAVLPHVHVVDMAKVDFGNLDSSFENAIVADNANAGLTLVEGSTQWARVKYGSDSERGNFGTEEAKNQLRSDIETYQILKPYGGGGADHLTSFSGSVVVSEGVLQPGKEYALLLERMPAGPYPAQSIPMTVTDLADKDILIRFTTAPADAAEIALGKDNLLMAAGATYQLVAKAKADDGSEYSAGFTWTSSDEDIVEVAEDGTVTAHAVGSATITVAADHGGVSAQCSITVVAVPEKASFVEGDSLSVTIDKAFDLTPAIDGDEKVAALFAWRFAEVEGITANADGTFTATKPGSFEMTASIVVDDDLFVLPEGFDSASLPVATATVKAEFATETPGGPLEDKSGDSPATGDAISSAALPQTGDAASVLAAAAAVAAVAGVGAAAGAAHKMKDADAE